MSYQQMSVQQLQLLHEDLSEQQINAQDALRELQKLAKQTTIERAFSLSNVTYDLKAVEQELQNRGVSF
jgi:L-lactate utilization protein LutB